MAIVNLQAESATATLTEFQLLHRAWRHAKARWEMAETDPANPKGLDNDEASPYCDAEHGALIEMFMHPASNLFELADKMIAYRDEDAQDFHEAREIFAQLTDDVLKLARPARS